MLIFHPSSGALNSSAVQLPVSRKSSVRNACAPYSGSTNCASQSARSSLSQGDSATHLVQLVAEVDGVDVVALEVGVHDNLRRRQESAVFWEEHGRTHEEHHPEEQRGGIEHREEEQPAYSAV